MPVRASRDSVLLFGCVRVIWALLCLIDGRPCHIAVNYVCGGIGPGISFAMTIRYKCIVKRRFFVVVPLILRILLILHPLSSLSSFSSKFHHPRFYIFSVSALLLNITTFGIVIVILPTILVLVTNGTVRIKTSTLMGYP